MHFQDLPFPVLGLSGGIASGKSYVGRLLQARGWVLLDADAAAREVVAPGTPGLKALVGAFGASILDGTGALDRGALAARVFADPASRATLEALLHPRIETHLEDALWALPPDTRGAVLDAALWVERSRAHAFDAFWVVRAPEDLRLRRIRQRDGLDESAARARLDAQTTDAERMLHADRVFENDGRDLEAVLTRAEAELLDTWRVRRAERWPLAPPPIPPEVMRELLGLLLSGGGDLAEIFLEHRCGTRLEAEGGRLEAPAGMEHFGVRLRLLREGTTHFTDLGPPSPEALREAIRSLVGPVPGPPVSLPPLVFRARPTPCPVRRPPDAVPMAEKEGLVRAAEAEARAEGERRCPGALHQVAVQYEDSMQEVWIATAQREGTGWTCRLAFDRRVRGHLGVKAAVEKGKPLQEREEKIGEARGFEQFTASRVTGIAREAVRLALQALEGQPAPVGAFPVLFSGRAGETLLRAACLPGLEADRVLAGASPVSGRLGERIAAPCVTLVDDGTLPFRLDSAAVDDEGEATRRVVLIERGILKGCLHSRQTARAMQAALTGNGRQEPAGGPPLPRGRNPFLVPGTETLEAILRDLDRGLLVKRLGSGQMDPATGAFVFPVTEGYWVEGGRLAYPVRNAILGGCGPEVLGRLTRIGACDPDLPSFLCSALEVGRTEETE